MLLCFPPPCSERGLIRPVWTVLIHKKGMFCLLQRLFRALNACALFLWVFCSRLCQDLVSAPRVGAAFFRPALLNVALPCWPSWYLPVRSCHAWMAVSPSPKSSVRQLHTSRGGRCPRKRFHAAPAAGHHAMPGRHFIHPPAACSLIGSLLKLTHDEAPTKELGWAAAHALKRPPAQAVFDQV